jgi:hypothetical protein
VILFAVSYHSMLATIWRPESAMQTSPPASLTHPVHDSHGQLPGTRRLSSSSSSSPSPCSAGCTLIWSSRWYLPAATGTDPHPPPNRLETERIDGYVTDDIVLHGLRSMSRMKDQLVVTGRALTFETYAIVVRRGDADFQLVVDSALSQLYRSPKIEAIYHRWFDPLGVPMTEANKYMYKMGSITP